MAGMSQSGRLPTSVHIAIPNLEKMLEPQRWGDWTPFGPQAEISRGVRVVCSRNQQSLATFQRVSAPASSGSPAFLFQGLSLVSSIFSSSSALWLFWSSSFACLVLSCPASWSPVLFRFVLLVSSLASSWYLLYFPKASCSLAPCFPISLLGFCNNQSHDPFKPLGRLFSFSFKVFCLPYT